MLQIVVHRVLANPCVSTSLVVDQALKDAFPGVAPREDRSLGYWAEDVWPHPGDVRDLWLMLGRALYASEERIGEYGGWHSLV